MTTPRHDLEAVRRARARARLVTAAASVDPVTAPIARQGNRVSLAVRRAEALRRDPEQYFRDARQAAEREVAAEQATTAPLARVPVRHPRRTVLRATWALFVLAVGLFYLVPIGAALGWW